MNDYPEVIRQKRCQVGWRRESARRRGRRETDRQRCLKTVQRCAM